MWSYISTHLCAFIVWCFIKNGDTVLIYCGMNLCGHVLDLYKEPFDNFITIRHQQDQDTVLHGRLKVTSQLAELQGSVS